MVSTCVTDGDGHLTQHTVDSEAETVHWWLVELTQFHRDRFFYHWNPTQLHTGNAISVLLITMDSSSLSSWKLSSLHDTVHGNAKKV